MIDVDELVIGEGTQEERASLLRENVTEENGYEPKVAHVGQFMAALTRYRSVETGRLAHKKPTLKQVNYLGYLAGFGNNGLAYVQLQWLVCCYRADMGMVGTAIGVYLK